MTTRIYYTDAYAREFSAAIVDRSDDGTRVYLAETAFYPTSGGQPHDLGTLGGVAVIDVVDEDDRVAHVLASPLAESGAGSAVAGHIDWSRRYDHMRQHTGQHLLSAVFEDLFGFKTVSVHFGPDYSTLDLDTESVSRKQLLAAESRANEIVAEARPVIVSFEDAASARGLRKASERSGTLRIVTIDGLDRSACGGTHVRSTAEIGAIMLRSTEKIRKAVRVEFLCGARAITRARQDFESLTSIAASLSASLDDAPALVATQVERMKEAESARKKLAQELAVYRTRERYDAATPDANGVRTIVVRDAATMDDVKAVAQAAFDLPRCVVVGALIAPPSVLVASSQDSGVDAGKLLKEKLAAVGGRGGGSPRLAQGSVPEASLLDTLVQQLVDRA
ncbi:MAG TPA: DHHA1 domain-containing protein [Gemmatimonadaceae bacterium]|nr:DHHA1 domain-containing protein [Gemmatimonadaceae bacterium]